MLFVGSLFTCVSLATLVASTALPPQFAAADAAAQPPAPRAFFGMGKGAPKENEAKESEAKESEAKESEAKESEAVSIPKYGARWLVEDTGPYEMLQFHVLVDEVIGYGKKHARPKPSKAQIDQLVAKGVDDWSQNKRLRAFMAEITDKTKRGDPTSYLLTFTTPSVAREHDMLGMPGAKLSAILRDTVEKWAELPEDTTGLSTIFVPPGGSTLLGVGSITIRASDQALNPEKYT